MPSILIRNLDDGLDKALRIRAAQHGHTRELEIKAILQMAVKQRPPKRSLAEALSQIPKADGFGALVKRSSSPARVGDIGI